MLNVSSGKYFAKEGFSKNKNKQKNTPPKISLTKRYVDKSLKKKKKKKENNPPK